MMTRTRTAVVSTLAAALALTAVWFLIPGAGSPGPSPFAAHSEAVQEADGTITVGEAARLLRENVEDVLAGRGTLDTRAMRNLVDSVHPDEDREVVQLLDRGVTSIERGGLPEARDTFWLAETLE
jgi:hypothetical protein